MSQNSLPPMRDVVAEELPANRQRLAASLKNSRTRELRYPATSFSGNTHVVLLRELVDAGWQYYYEGTPGTNNGIYVIVPDEDRLKTMSFTNDRAFQPLPTAFEVTMEQLPNIRTRLTQWLRNSATKELRLSAETFYGSTAPIITRELEQQGWHCRLEGNATNGVYVISPNIERLEESLGAAAAPAQGLPDVREIINQQLPQIRTKVGNWLRNRRTTELRLSSDEFPGCTSLVIRKELAEQGWDTRFEGSSNSGYWVITPNTKRVEAIVLDEGVVREQGAIPSVHDVLAQALPPLRTQLAGYLRNRRGSNEVRISVDSWVGGTSTVLIKELKRAGWNVRHEGGNGSGYWVISPMAEMIESMPVPEVTELPSPEGLKERTIVQARAVLAARMNQSGGAEFEYPARNFPANTSRVLIPELMQKGWLFELHEATLDKPAYYVIRPRPTPGA